MTTYQVLIDLRTPAGDVEYAIIKEGDDRNELDALVQQFIGHLVDPDTQWFSFMPLDEDGAELDEVHSIRAEDLLGFHVMPKVVVADNTDDEDEEELVHPRFAKHPEDIGRETSNRPNSSKNPFPYPPGFVD